MSSTLYKRPNDYTQVANTVLSDSRLSWKARGIYAFLVSKATIDGWKFNRKWLIEQSCPDGKASFDKGMKELKDFGYVQIAKQFLQGRISYRWEILDKPISEKQVPENRELYNRIEVKELKDKPPTPLEGGVSVEGKSNKTAQRENKSTVESNSSPPATEKETEKFPYPEIVADLNSKAGSDFKPTSQATRRLIRARFREGFALPDFKHVHSVKCAEWQDDPEMQKYLCPGTLYRPSNFEKYLNQKARSDPNAWRYGGETKPEIPAWRLGQ